MERYCKNNKPYIYVAFPEERENDVLPVLEKLNREGVQFWYRHRFDRREQHRIEGAFGVLLFITGDFFASDRFSRIVDHSVICNQKILSIYLENIPATPWSSMQLGSQQALFCVETAESILPKLKESFILRDMVVTSAQKRFQRNRGIAMVAMPVLAAAILFVTVISPLLIAPARAADRQAERWGMTREDLQNITDLYIVGDRAFYEDVAFWYSSEDHSTITVREWTEDGEIFTEISAGELTNEDLSILRYMPNLRTLSIAGNNISDISPFLELDNLVSLNLSGNPVSSLEGIGSMTQLETVDFSYTYVQDLTPLWECRNLSEVFLNSTYITSLNGIEALKDLGRIDIGSTKIVDVSPLDNAEALRCFDADLTLITRIPEFIQTENVIVNIDATPVHDYLPLQRIQSFRILRMSEHDLSAFLPYIEGKPIDAFVCAGLGIDSLEDLSGLVITPGGELNLAACSLTSLKGIEHFEGIANLDLKYAYGLKDLTPILSLHSLQQLVISPDMEDLAVEQLKGADFIICYMDD